MASDKLTLVHAQCHILAFCPLAAQGLKLEQVLHVVDQLDLGVERVDRSMVDASAIQALSK